MVTHQKWLLNAVKLPLTIPGTVYKGMCLECNSGTNAKLLLNERLSRAAGYAPSIFSPRDHGGEIKGVPTEDTTEISSLTADFSNVMLTNAGALNEAEEDHLRAGDQLGIMLPQCPMNVGSLEKTRGVGMDLDLDGLESMDHGFASAEIDSVFRTDSISMDSSKTVFDPKKYRDAEEAKRARRLRRGAC